MTTRRFLLAVLGLVLTLLALPVGGWAKDRGHDDDHADRRRRLDREIQQLDRQLDALRREERAAKSVAERCDKQIPRLREQVSQEKSAVAGLQKEADALQSRVDAAEHAARAKGLELQAARQESLDAAPRSSPVTQAHERYEAARKQYAAQVRAIEESAAYRNAYQAAMAAEDRTVQLPRVRAEFVAENPEAAALQTALLKAKNEFDKLSGAYFVAQPNCVRLEQDWKKLRCDAEDLNQQRTALAGRQKKAIAALRDHQKELSAAEAASQQAAQRLRTLPSQIRRLDNELDHRRAERRKLH